MSLEAINKTSIQVTSSSATYGEKTEGQKEEINTTFAVQFIKGHCAWVSGGVTDVEFDDDFFAVVVSLYFV